MTGPPAIRSNAQKPARLALHANTIYDTRIRMIRQVRRRCGQRTQNAGTFVWMGAWAVRLGTAFVERPRGFVGTAPTRVSTSAGCPSAGGARRGEIRGEVPSSPGRTRSEVFARCSRDSRTLRRQQRLSAHVTSQVTERGSEQRATGGRAGKRALRPHDQIDVGAFTPYHTRRRQGASTAPSGGDSSLF